MSSPGPDQQPAGDMACQDIVQLITAYLDGDLADDLRAQVDEHLVGCDGCQNVLAQWRTVIALAGRLTEADVDNVDEITRDRLVTIVRGLRRR